MLPASLLSTKFSIPPVRHERISRPRLLAWLDQATDFRLVLISAPAGYGKTTLLSEWAAQQIDRMWRGWRWMKPTTTCRVF
jgi:LuxR family maltose regulon positive regulatory protein